MPLRIVRIVLIGALIAVFAAAAGAQSKTGTRGRTTNSPAKESNTEQTSSSAAESGRAKQSEPANAGICRDLAERAAEWDRNVVHFAKEKAVAEADFANCQLRQKEGKALPNECRQHEYRIAGANEWLDKAVSGKKEVSGHWQHYGCR